MRIPFFRNEAAAPAVRTVVITPTGETRVTLLQPAPIPGDNRTSDERYFGTDFYLTGIVFRRGRFYCPNPPAISRELLGAVLEQASPLFSRDDEKRIAEIKAQLKRADEQLCEAAYVKVTSFLPAYFARQIDAAVAAGEQPPQAPSYQERMGQTEHIRAALHRRKRQLFEEAFTILKPGVQKFAKAAWAVCKALDKEERGGLLRRWRIEVAPSSALRSAVFLALSALDPIRFFEAGGLVSVSCEVGELWGHLLEQQRPAAPAGLTMADARQEAREREDRRRQEEMDQETSEHRAKVSALNKFNDSIRLQTPGDLHPTGGYHAQAAKVPEAKAPEK
jgi:hypothetical protein